MKQDQSASRYRPATLVECLVTIKARLSDHLSPAEQRELQQAIEYIGNDDEPMDAPRSEQQPLRSALKLAQDWIEKEEGESMQQILQKEGQFNELGRHCYNSQFVAVCRAVTAALAQSNER